MIIWIFYVPGTCIFIFHVRNNYYINEYYNLRKSVFLWILTLCIWDFKVFKTSKTVFHYEKLRPKFIIDLFYVVRQTHQNLAFWIWIFWKIDCPCHIKAHLDNVIVSVNVKWKLSPPPKKRATTLATMKKLGSEYIKHIDYYYM